MHYCMISQVESKKIKFIDTDQMGGCQRPGNWEQGEMGKGGQKVQTSSYKINKISGHNVQHGNYS